MTIPPDAPRGKRYSLTYLDRGEPVADRPRARMRFAKLLHDTGSVNDIRERIQSKIGINPPDQNFLPYWQNFIADQSLVDFLDIVVIVAQILEASTQADRYGVDKLHDFVDDVRNIFTEENLAYQVDDLVVSA